MQLKAILICTHTTAAAGAELTAVQCLVLCSDYAE